MMKWIWPLLLLPTSLWATPGSIEVWFLSVKKITQLQQYLDRPQYIFRAPTAELQCQEVGDLCFDPQFGLYKKDDVTKSVAVEDTGPTIPTGKSVERDLIDCDPKNYFDIFCGKAKPQAQASTAKLDLWIDTSSSMREYDFAPTCNRQALVEKLDRTCGFNQKMNVMLFDTSIKQAGEMSSVCQNVGTNDYKKLIDWIERSTAPKLVIITDINELHREFSDYVESKHGIIRGDKDILTSEKMLDLADNLAKSCK